MTKEFVCEYISNKIITEGNFIRCTFYDLRIRHNLSADEVEEFLKEAKDILEDKDYQVYFTTAKYTYKHSQRTVQDNEYLIAIKENT
ncbi:MAG: hypothetical protein J6I85_07065 [Clostridia bacterium]|nr:hypothetical protein [Clostridia bacterium]MBP3801760.1 hypothetical protein [Clostridia bacterium]